MSILCMIGDNFVHFIYIFARTQKSVCLDSITFTICVCVYACFYTYLCAIQFINFKMHIKLLLNMGELYLKLIFSSSSYNEIKLKTTVNNRLQKRLFKFAFIFELHMVITFYEMCFNTYIHNWKTVFN